MQLPLLSSSRSLSSLSLSLSHFFPLFSSLCAFFHLAYTSPNSFTRLFNLFNHSTSSFFTQLVYLKHFHLSPLVEARAHSHNPPLPHLFFSFFFNQLLQLYHSLSLFLQSANLVILNLNKMTAPPTTCSAFSSSLVPFFLRALLHSVSVAATSLTLFSASSGFATVQLKPG